MYFEKLFNDYSDNVNKLFVGQSLREVKKLYEIKNNTYRVSTINDGEESYIIRYDLNTILNEVFNFSEAVIKALKKENTLVGSIFNTKDDSASEFADNNTAFIKKIIKNDHKIFLKEHNEITIMFWKASTALSISDEGVYYFDVNGYVSSDLIQVLDNDGESAIIEAIHSFNKNLAAMVNIDTKVFNKSFFEKINQLSYAECFNLRKRVDEFKFVDREDIETFLKPLREKDRFSSHWIGDDNTVFISSTYTDALLDSVKLILNDDTYAHFLKAFNFYHNYKSMMNEQYMSTIQLCFRHKLDQFDTSFITINLGCQFEINISVPFRSEDLSRTFIFHVSGSVIPDETYVSLHTDTLVELYDYIFESCNRKVLSLVDKSLTQFETRDVELIRMIKI